MFISNAYAQAGPSGAFDPSSLFLMVGIIAIFYFLLIRPQQKRAREHKEMLANVKRGEKIITTGGIIAKISKVAEDSIIIEVDGGVQLSIVRDGIATVVDKTLPAKPKAKADNDTAEKPAGPLAGLFGGRKKDQK